MNNRPWHYIWLFAIAAVYLLYAVGAAAFYFLQQGQSLRLMTAYIPTFLLALFCTAVSVGLYFRKQSAQGVAKWASGGASAFIKTTTPTWVSLNLLILSWIANAVISAYL